MMKLRDDEREELGRLWRENGILRTKVQHYIQEREQAARELEKPRRLARDIHQPAGLKREPVTAG